jgi:hypothetical protein
MWVTHNSIWSFQIPRFKPTHSTAPFTILTHHEPFAWSSPDIVARHVACIIRSTSQAKRYNTQDMVYIYTTQHNARNTTLVVSN